MTVRPILRANTDAHDYEPRAGDVRAAADASVLLASGKGLDPWMGEIAEQGGVDAVDVGAGLAGEDPHWWHDPGLGARAADAIAEAFARAAPSRAAAFRRAADGYGKRLAATDRAIARCVESLPEAERKLVTDHDAFSRFAARYGLRVIGTVIPSQTTQGQASARELAQLARRVRRERVRAIFPEESISSRAAEALARTTGATARHRLYGDSLGPAGSPGATYLGMLRANADAVVRGLTGGERGCPA